MSKKKWLVFGGILISLVFVVVVTSYAYIVPSEGREERVNISVVVYGGSTEQWTSFRQGVELAAADQRANINFITMVTADGWEDQLRILSQEKESGANGMIVAPVDSYQMEEELVRFSEKLPLVVVDSSMENKIFTCISADDFAMGKRLAELIVENEVDAGDIWTTMSDRRWSSRQRLEGFQKTMEDKGYQVLILSNEDEDGIERIIKENGILVALDNTTLELVAEKADKNKNMHIYGIGSSGENVYALDDGRICGIVFQNEFNVGYEAAECVIRQIRHKTQTEEVKIDFYAVTRETLHFSENERLLYPLTW